MKLFLDTANLKEIQEISEWGVLDGITTNPTLISKEGSVSLEKHVKAICKVVQGPVSVEVISTDLRGMLREAHEYAKWAENIVVKVPMTAAGLMAVQALSRVSIPTNVTLCFTANQALLAAKAGAAIISPFIGRLEDRGEDGMQLVDEIVTIYEQYNFTTEVLVASVRNVRHVTDSALLGADIATLPYAIFKELIEHDLTDAGIKKFIADWKKVKHKK
ncbi:MAG: fructose-6-phosphate aldolase [Patescibacteria group bacterium]